VNGNTGCFRNPFGHVVAEPMERSEDLTFGQRFVGVFRFGERARDKQKQA